MDIGCATECVQLHFLFSCGEHMRHCTPHAVKSPIHLVCRYCADEEELEDARLARPSKWERAVFEALCDRGLGAGLRPEARLAHWHGRIDFMHHPSGVLIQVDGEGHFQERMYNLPRTAHMSHDLSMCKWAWEEGRVLVRVHYRDVAAESAALLIARTIKAASRESNRPLLVLSPAFNPPNPNNPKTMHKQMTLLRMLSQLNHAQTRKCSSGSIWIERSPESPRRARGGSSRTGA